MSEQTRPTTVNITIHLHNAPIQTRIIGASRPEAFVSIDLGPVSLFVRNLDHVAMLRAAVDEAEKHLIDNAELPMVKALTEAGRADG